MTPWRSSSATTEPTASRSSTTKATSSGRSAAKVKQGHLFLPVLFVIATLPGITNYPIGVGINGAGEITIADNHNNFNLSVFSQDGQLISALESKVVTSVLNYEYSITNWFKTFLSPWRWLFPIDQYDLCTLT